MKINHDIPLGGDSLRGLGTQAPERRGDDLDVRTDGAFDDAVLEARSRQTLRPPLSQRLETLAAPAPVDVSSFTNDRSIDLLRHVLDHVLPRLEDDDAQATAKTILEEEIGWREAWQARLDDLSSAFPGSENDDQENS
ncbi:hypothetical protein [Kushneria marisflavi]|uniref:hypothetical protein n=1 Tax=Kushneria marisflavi TaxID=157779 RepID=UPI000FED2023|nr:hypothetical protein [Kushneria marisflavi]RKD87176.1 hypothetical protein C8D96_0634 [Kushneria marisflavi]